MSAGPEATQLWLEAEIWRAMTDFGVTTDRPIGFVARVSAVAASLAAGDDPGLQAERRRILFRESAP